MFELFWSFFKLGLFTFGGGAAMLALLEEEMVNRKKWLSKQEMIDYFAIGQCTPGIIAINTATLVGYKVKGKKGAIMATLGIIMPSLVIIIVVASILQNFLEYEMVKNAFAGIRIVVVAMIAEVICGLWKTSIKSKMGIVIFGISLVLLFGLKLSPVWIVLVGTSLGYVYLRRRIK
jgi:chromate transporter